MCGMEGEGWPLCWGIWGQSWVTEPKPRAHGGVRVVRGSSELLGAQGLWQRCWGCWGAAVEVLGTWGHCSGGAGGTEEVLGTEGQIVLEVLGAQVLLQRCWGHKGTLLRRCWRYWGVDLKVLGTWGHFSGGAGDTQGVLGTRRSCLEGSTRGGRAPSRTPFPFPFHLSIALHPFTPFPPSHTALPTPSPSPQLPGVPLLSLPPSPKPPSNIFLSLQGRDAQLLAPRAC